jgi:hypothetical protein
LGQHGIDIGIRVGDDVLVIELPEGTDALRVNDFDVTGIA